MLMCNIGLHIILHIILQEEFAPFQSMNIYSSEEQHAHLHVYQVHRAW